MVLVNMSPREKRADAKKMQDSEVPEAKENKGPFFPAIDVSEGISPELYKLGLQIRSQKPRLDNLPEDYIQRIKSQTENHDMGYIKKRYNEDYPIIDPDAATDWDRRGKPHQYHPDGTPIWPNNEIPKGIRIENMTAHMLGAIPSGHDQTPWQEPDVGHCAARREASSGGHAAHGYSYGGTQPSYSYSNRTPYEAAPPSSMGSASQGNNSSQTPYNTISSSTGSSGGAVTGVGAQNGPADFGGNSCDWQRSHIS